MGSISDIQKNWEFLKKLGIYAKLISNFLRFFWKMTFFLRKVVLRKESKNQTLFKYVSSQNLHEKNIINCSIP